jgi:hypothetical protein
MTGVPEYKIHRFKGLYYSTIQLSKISVFRITRHYVLNSIFRVIYPKNRSQSICHTKNGGGERDRTDGLLRARQALSQLSYTPINQVVGLGGFEPPTSRLSGVRSNQLSYRPSLNRCFGFYLRRCSIWTPQRIYIRFRDHFSHSLLKTKTAGLKRRTTFSNWF